MVIALVPVFWRDGHPLAAGCLPPAACHLTLTAYRLQPIARGRTPGLAS